MRMFELILHIIVVISFFAYVCTFGRTEAAVFMISASMSIGICIGEGKAMARKVRSATSQKV